MGVCKAALDAAVKYLAYDLGPKKIRVNAVSAGPVKTLAASAVGDFEDLAGLYVAVSPLGRNITREEVGSAGMFLLSDLASGITGEIMHVDCGYSVMGSPGRAIEAAKQALKAPRARLEADVHAQRADRSSADEKPIPVGIGLISRDGCFLVRTRPERDGLRRVLGVSRRQVRARRASAPGRRARMPRGNRPATSWWAGAGA